MRLFDIMEIFDQPPPVRRKAVLRWLTPLIPFTGKHNIPKFSHFRVKSL